MITKSDQWRNRIKFKSMMMPHLATMTHALVTFHFDYWIISFSIPVIFHKKRPHKILMLVFLNVIINSDICVSIILAVNQANDSKI